ncbi:hypothetical protein SGLAM104S_03243 [Streptomyces glaucescens]
MLAKTIAVAATTVTPRSMGRSLSVTARTARVPSPWRLNVDSVMIAPPIRVPMSIPKIVTIGPMAPRQAKRKKTLRPDRPLARAVRT